MTSNSLLRLVTIPISTNLRYLKFQVAEMEELSLRERKSIQLILS